MLIEKRHCIRWDCKNVFQTHVHSDQTHCSKTCKKLVQQRRKIIKNIAQPKPAIDLQTGA